MNGTSAEIKTRIEAALVDLALAPVPFDDPWRSQTHTAKLVSRHSRLKSGGAGQVEELYQDLRRRGVVKEKRRSKSLVDVLVTEVGRAALAAYSGVRLDVGGIRLERGPLLGKLATWCGAHFGADLHQVVAGSRFPFPSSKATDPVDFFEKLFARWVEQERDGYAYGLLQECCSPVWWAGRESEHKAALLEIMGLLQHLGLLVTWEGVIVPSGEAVDEERVLRLMRSAGSPTTETTAIADVPLPERSDIPWDGPENEFTKGFVVPLLQALRFQAVRFVGGPGEDGKDVVCRYLSPLWKPRWVHVQVKLGLSGVAKRGDMVELKEQIDRAFDMPFPDPMSGQQVYASEVWVVVASKLTATAQRCVVSITNGRARKSNLTVLDRPELESLYDRARGGS